MAVTASRVCTWYIRHVDLFRRLTSHDVDDLGSQPLFDAVCFVGIPFEGLIHSARGREDEEFDEREVK